MLSVLDRKMRLRVRRLEPFADGSGSFEAEVAAGAMQHLDDDRWFHTTRAFVETSAELTNLFRTVLGEADRMRCPFLGHIVTELQLDAVLMERYPDHLDRYYDSVSQIDSQALEGAVNQMATKTSDRLAWLLDRFSEEQFMRCYPTANRLRFRLNQVMLRVGLEQIPETIEPLLETSQVVVRERADDLLPQEHFDARLIGP